MRKVNLFKILLLSNEEIFEGRWEMWTLTISQVVTDTIPRMESIREVISIGTQLFWPSIDIQKNIYLVRV